MDILIDQRIELITTIQTLCGYWDNLAEKFLNKKLFQCGYKENLHQYFEKYLQNETISLYKNLCNDERDISAFLTLILNHSDPPALCKNEYYNDDKYDHFMESVRKFYAETGFDSFFINNKDEYEKIKTDFGYNDRLLNDINNIFDFLDIESKNYNVIISLLVFGNFGINTCAENFVVMSPRDYVNNKYVFGSKEAVRNIIWHEFAHTVINVLTRKYYDPSKYQNKTIPEIFRKNLYNDMEIIVNEYIIRSIAYLLEKDGNCAKALLDYEKKSGFTKIEKINNYIFSKCIKNNKLIKSAQYEKLIDYVIKVI